MMSSNSSKVTPTWVASFIAYRVNAWKNSQRCCALTTSKPLLTTQDWMHNWEATRKTPFSKKTSTWLWPPSPLVWASTNPMCASSSTTTFPKALKDITKKPDALAVMAARASALPSILIKISKNWRNLWKVNPLANKTLVVNFSKRRPLMPSLLCADVSCSFITLENNMKALKAAAIVTIVNTLINKWKEKIIYVELSRLFLNARKTSPMTTLKTYWWAMPPMRLWHTITMI